MSNGQLGDLDKVSHIVVLMMENRSFDQMLGYLKRDGEPEVNGLTGAESNPDPDGHEYQVFEWSEAETVFHPPEDTTGKILDPCHGPDCVKDQLAGGNKGFVKNFVTSRAKDGHVLPEQYRGLPMGYYTGKHLPVYDYLARQYCVCDAWHASIPGDTWPNRLYALAGRSADKVGHKPGPWHNLLNRLKGVPVLGSLPNAPIYDVAAFTRQLDETQWRWYSHDPSILRASDKTYRDIRHPKRDNFAYFNRKRLSPVTQVLETAIVGPDGFLDDAANGKLRDVSWIDPNFIDLNVLDPSSNDDHPPSDVRAGQALVLELYEALVNSPNWEETILVIVYDEHGGFYDHAPPPAVNDGSGFPTLGVRVPALIVGPRVKQFVCHQTFEHTTLIATILRRFAKNPEQAMSRMPARVQTAPDLGQVLESTPRTDIADHADLHDQLEHWRQQARAQRRGQDGQPSRLPDGAGHPAELLDFEGEFAQFALAMRDKGLPPGQP
jgi:phospholipase C